MLRRRPIMRMAATTAVVAGTATAVSGRVNRRQQAKADAAAPAPVEQAPAPVEEAPAPEPFAPPSAGLSAEAMTQLQQLGALKAEGVLTEAEFAAEKAKILGA
jgi:hypothetical protein